MDLSDYEAEREGLVEDTVMHLNSSMGELNPFTKEHISEALMELNDEQIADIAELCQQMRHPISRPSKDTLEILGRAIWCDIYEYWENIAKIQAEKDTPSAYELYQDDQQEALDRQREAARDARMGL